MRDQVKSLLKDHDEFYYGYTFGFIAGMAATIIFLSWRVRQL